MGLLVEGGHGAIKDHALEQGDGIHVVRLPDIKNKSF